MPVAAESQTPPACPAASRIDFRLRARGDRSCCRLRAAGWTPRRSREHAASTCAMRCSRSGSAASTTCSSRSASRASFSVERNAATSSCGRSRTKPTVSATTTIRRVRQSQPAHRRIERREQLVRHVGIRARQRVEQRRLAGVRVTDQRNARHRHALAHLAAGVAALRELLELRGERADALADQAAVGLELRLAGTAQADAALLPLEVGPAAHQARRQMLAAARARPAACLRRCARAARRCRG